MRGIGNYEGGKGYARGIVVREEGRVGWVRCGYARGIVRYEGMLGRGVGNYG